MDMRNMLILLTGSVAFIMTIGVWALAIRAKHREKVIAALRNSLEMSMHATAEKQEGILVLSRFITYSEALLDSSGIDHIDPDTGMFKQYYGNITEKPKLTKISPSQHYYHINKLKSNASPNVSEQLRQIGQYSDPM